MATFIADAYSFIGTLAFDVGSVVTRAGYAGEDSPRLLYPSTVCTWPADGGGDGGDGNGQRHCILENDRHLSAASLARVQARPLHVRQTVDEWVMRELLEHGLQHLGCREWAEHPVILSEPTASEAAARRRTAEFMFEEVGVPALCVCRTAELVAIGAGRPTAVIVEAGGSGTTAAVVADGAVLARSVHSSKLGGVMLARLLARQTAQRYGALQPACSLRATCDPSYHAVRLDELARSMWESVGRCVGGGGRGSAASAKAAATKAVAEYTLPDGRVLELSKESTEAAECFFTSPSAQQSGARG